MYTFYAQDQWVVTAFFQQISLKFELLSSHPIAKKLVQVSERVAEEYLECGHLSESGKFYRCFMNRGH